MQKLSCSLYFERGIKLFFCLLILHTTSSITPAQNTWFNTGLNYRVLLSVDPAKIERNDKPVEVDVNFTKLLNSLDEAAGFNSNSLRVVEVDKLGQIVDLKTAFQFDRAPNYDSEKNAQGKLTLLLKGKTTALRYFQIYFDANSALRAAVVPSQLALQEKIEHEGQESFKITANGTTYIYHKQGAGFASIIDRAGNDWISYHPGNKSAGEFRGLPNLGDFAHPGYTNSRSTIVQRGPLKISILSETLDGKNAVQWDIFPDFARMTLLRAEKPYWFLYEGTPAGKLDLDTAFMVNSEGRKTYARQDWQFDLPSPEWIYFGDEKTTRALFLAHHEDDSQYDQFWQMDGNMTVFGFGRQYRCCSRYLSQTPTHFTIGFVEDANFYNATNVINSAYRDVIVTLGKPELRYETMASNNAVTTSSRPRTLTNEMLEAPKPVVKVYPPKKERNGLEPPYRSKPEHQFYGGYCTWYASRKFKEFTGYPVTWSGDGGAWYTNAEGEGRNVTTDATKAVPGAIMVWTRGRSETKGHVAFVEEVDEKGIYISEMNVRGLWVVSTAFIPFENLDKGTKYKFKGIILPE